MQEMLQHILAGLMHSSIFFPWTTNEWNKLNFNIRISSFNIFRANLIKIIQLILNSVFGIFYPLGLKLITALQIGLTCMNEHRFNHNFNDCINPLCICSLCIKSTVHYFLYWNYYNSARISLLRDLNSVDRTLVNLSDPSLVNDLLYGSPQFDDSQNPFISNSSIKYILISERFSRYILLFSFAVIIILYPFQFDFIHFQISSDLLSSN